MLSTSASNELYKPYIRKWYEQYKREGLTTSVFYNRSANQNVYSDSVIVAKAIIQNDYLYGIVLYEVKSYIFNNILQKNTPEGITKQVLYDDLNGDIFFSTDESLIGQNISKAGFPVNFKDIKREQKYKNLLFLKSAVNYTYYFVLQTDLNASRNITVMIIALVSLVLVVLLISFVISFYLSLQFYQGIINIASTLHDDAEGGESGNHRELYYINNHIVSQLRNTSNIEQKLSEQLTALKKAQFIALQSQLNPHFMYNTLNLINVMVLNIAKKDCNASRAIVIFSQLLRETLNTKEYIVPLRTELEYVKKYIMLQQLKYNYTINVDYDIDKSLMEHNVIKFMLQPIIENAFEHGFINTEDKEYRISFSAKEYYDKLVFTIKNNGKTIKPEELKKLQASLKSDLILDQKSHGLLNVNYRIRLIYGDRYGCSVESSDNVTTVRISLPNDKNQLN